MFQLFNEPMKILLISRMLPSLGGLETMGRLMALEWEKDPGIELRILTDCDGGPIEGIKSPLLRNPGLKEMNNAYRWADVIFFNHCYLKLAIPLLYIRRPYVVSMSGMVPVGGSLLGRMKSSGLRILLKRADSNIVACEAMRRENKVDAEIIVNPFDSSSFRATTPVNERHRDFIFAGRVHEIKGVFDMVRALAKLRNEHKLEPTLSVAGDGAHWEAMLELAASLGVAGQIHCLGILSGPALAAEMNRHRCILVPSKYIEPIGICCLEGIACGCVAIGSSGGGLGESVGPCGFTFPNGDVDALAECMKKVINLSPAEIETFTRSADKHLAKYQPETVMAQYLEHCKAVLG